MASALGDPPRERLEGSWGVPGAQQQRLPLGKAGPGGPGALPRSAFGATSDIHPLLA